MTTPPDTPKPPVCAHDWYRDGVHAMTCRLCGADSSYPPPSPPSPQESHKLAEELERLVRLPDELATFDYVCDNLGAILAALRSSPSEQDARDAGRYRLIRRVSLPEWERLGHYTEEALDEQIDAAIAASGGAKGDGK